MKPLEYIVRINTEDSSVEVIRRKSIFAKYYGYAERPFAKVLEEAAQAIRIDVEPHNADFAKSGE